MDAARQDFRISSNSDMSEEWTFTVDGVTGIDIAGYSFKMAFKSAPGTASLFTLETVATPVQGLYPVEPENGFLQLRLDSETLNAQIVALNPSVFVGNELRLYYDLVVTLPDTTEEVWLFGYLTIVKGITNV